MQLKALRYSGQYKTGNRKSGVHFLQISSLHLNATPRRPDDRTGLNEGPGKWRKKMLQIMKLTAILLFAACMQMQARGYSQITLREVNAPLQKVIKEIQKQSGNDFLYSYELLQKSGKVTVRLNNVSLQQALEECLTGKGLTYEIQVKTVIIKRKEINSNVVLFDNSPPPVQVKGKVKSGGGEPLAGATVAEKGTKNTVTTLEDGSFAINISDARGVLVISYIGYETQEVSAANAATSNVVLQQKAVQSDEVVVMGYGSQRRTTVTGSVVSVSGKELLKAPVMNLTNSLAGRLPGLTAVQRSGEPGQDGSLIRIRGVNTLGNNEALIVIDGVPGRSLDRIDPQSIESISVLKDASAAIYGSQAANGVILVTTKRGKAGKPVFTIDLNQGFNQPTVIPKMSDAAEYATLLNEIKGGTIPVYTAAEIQKFRDGSDPWHYSNTDWFATVLKPWSSQNYVNTTLSGGAEKLQYFLSFGSKTQDGIYKNGSNKYKQYDFRSNIDATVSKNVKIGFDVAGRLEQNQLPNKGGSSYSIFNKLLIVDPTKYAYLPDGKLSSAPEHGANPALVGTDQTGYSRRNNYTVNSNFKIAVNIPWIEGLSITGNAAYDKVFGLNKDFLTPWYLYSWDGQTRDASNNPVTIKDKFGPDQAQLSESVSDVSNLLLNGIVNYEKKISKHQFKVLAGMESIVGKGDNLTAFRKYFISPFIDQLFAGGDAEKDNSGSAFENARLNYFGRLNYVFDNKLLVEFVGRYDGSYIFPEKGRYGFFPGVSVGYRLAEEKFWKNNLSFISNFKFRASWGQTGNDRIAEWQYLSSYQFGTNSYILGSTIENRLLSESRIPNPLVTWEVANQANIGFDANFFSNKISVEFDYFDNKRSNILWTRNASVPASAGISLPRENIGKVQNKGFEFNIGYHNQLGQLTYSVSVNGSYAKNKITFWDESPGRPEWQKSTGRPIPTNANNPDGDLYYQSIGIFKDQAAVDAYPHWSGAQPGDVIFKDVNGDLKIDGNDRVRNEKTNIPTFMGGLNLNLSYGRFDLSILMQGAAGAITYINTYSGESGNFLEDFYNNRWTKENPVSRDPRAYNRNVPYWKSNLNTQWIRNTDYIRLKNFVFGYTLPNRVNRYIGIQGIRIYVSGNNLITFCKGLKDFDPESYTGGDSGDNATLSYPLARTVNGGISITF